MNVTITHNDTLHIVGLECYLKRSG